MKTHYFVFFAGGLSHFSDFAAEFDGGFISLTTGVADEYF